MPRVKVVKDEAGVIEGKQNHAHKNNIVREILIEHGNQIQIGMKKDKKVIQVLLLVTLCLGIILIRLALVEEQVNTLEEQNEVENG